MKYLHIYDDNKATSVSISLFETLNYEQRYIVISADQQKWAPIQAKTPNLTLIQENENLMEGLRQEIEAHDIIFLHPFSFFKAKLLNKYKFKNKVFIWVLWGFDLYNFADYYSDKSTYRTTTKQKGIRSKIEDFYSFGIVYKKAIKKVDICMFLLEEDFKILSSVIDHKAVWMTSIYPTLEYYLKNLESFELKGDSILVGNSATPSNRHAYAFEQLQKTFTQGRQIICPLNYGEESYANEAEQLGNDLFGDQMNAIRDFMPLEQYMKLLQSCSHGVFAHDRQQAFGNIVILLYLGSKVFLSPDSPIYTWLVKNGIIVYRIDQDLETELSSLLGGDEIQRNRKILHELLSTETFQKNQNQIMHKSSELWKEKNSI